MCESGGREQLTARAAGDPRAAQCAPVPRQHRAGPPGPLLCASTSSASARLAVSKMLLLLSTHLPLRTCTVFQVGCLPIMALQRVR